MPVAPVDMLRRLGSGVRPGAARVGGEAFSGMALQARQDRARGRSVRINRQLTDIELSDKRLEQIAIAADAAEAAGARTLLTLDDRGAYVVDLATRTIERARQTRGAVDAPVSAPKDAEAGDQAKGAAPSEDVRAGQIDAIAGVLVGVDAVAVLPKDEEQDVDRLFATADGLLDASGMENANRILPSGVCNASLAHLLAACMSGSAGA